MPTTTGPQRTPRSERWRAGAALVKGGVMLLFGLAVLRQAVWRVWHPELPDSRTMGAVGILALAANLACFALLYRHRGDDLNMRSTWLCSRNDVVANLVVILAAGASWFTASRWPDLVVGSGIALLFVSSALGVIGEGRIALWGYRPRHLPEARPDSAGRSSAVTRPPARRSSAGRP